MEQGEDARDGFQMLPLGMIGSEQIPPALEQHSATWAPQGVSGVGWDLILVKWGVETGLEGLRRWRPDARSIDPWIARDPGKTWGNRLDSGTYPVIAAPWHSTRLCHDMASFAGYRRPITT